ncbi:MAG TPA: acetyl-CoA carboxylase biotin carboxylase subunit, partial [Halothiobacillaceae bacterium]|nr:acetyl-CoA carboxylase biotin carboxylase subunit [Halothiobacillaceae bacterium]
MRGALEEMLVDGIKTNIPLHRDLMADASFVAGGMDIHFLHKRLGIS